MKHLDEHFLLMFNSQLTLHRIVPTRGEYLWTSSVELSARKDILYERKVPQRLPLSNRSPRPITAPVSTKRRNFRAEETAVIVRVLFSLLGYAWVDANRRFLLAHHFREDSHSNLHKIFVTAPHWIFKKMHALQINHI